MNFSARGVARRTVLRTERPPVRVICVRRTFGHRPPAQEFIPVRRIPVCQHQRENEMTLPTRVTKQECVWSLATLGWSIWRLEGSNQAARVEASSGAGPPLWPGLESFPARRYLRQ